MTKPEKLTVSHRVQIVRPDGESQEQEEELLREYEITIYINGQSKLECSCTPLDLDNFVVGRMFTEGVIEEITDILDYEIYPEEHCVYVTVKEENQKILQKNGQSNCRKRKKSYSYGRQIGFSGLQIHLRKILCCIERHHAPTAVFWHSRIRFYMWQRILADTMRLTR